MEYIRQAISEHYQLHVHSVVKISGGWTADAYRAKTAEADYFIKIYDKRRPSVRPWIDRMDLYMPVVLWLYEHTLLRNSMTAPLLTTSRAYKVEDQHSILLLFPMLLGITVGNQPVNAEQIRQLAVILAELHAHGSNVPISTDALREEYTLPFLQGLITTLGAKDMPTNVQTALRPYESAIKRGAEVLQELAESLRESSPPAALCHTDVHGGNLMWTNKMMLVDWEGLCLAPVEADLFAFADEFFFDYAREEFLLVYQSIRKGYVENQVAMRFYCLRRRLEDIAEFVDSLANDPLSLQNMTYALQYLNKECLLLGKLLV